ncbi:hypothetical protein [Leifsonia soli]|uniref:Uncharacterized protein n=1 Tax=Leifsonia soli TaxID=582665 RepID=A0A852SXK7_9MICO|nr:hypothetical protein [Leifsonia soli]NYD73314.1 hypothetical protein [Leifsonia soli]
MNELLRKLIGLGNLADPVHGRRVGDIVRGVINGTRWVIVDMRFLGYDVTGRPKVEYLVRPLRLLRKLPPVWTAAERFRGK